MGNTDSINYKKFYYKDYWGDQEKWRLKLNGEKVKVDREGFKEKFINVNASMHAIKVLRKPLELLNNSGIRSFRLETLYPGLLVGSGYMHEAQIDEEHKLGFYFDHSTGLPLIPGSSIKGTLRSYFPMVNIENLTKGQESWSELDNAKAERFSLIVHDAGIELSDMTAHQIALFGYSVFEGVDWNRSSKSDIKHLKSSHRDVFFDAYPADAHPLFSVDTITPHNEWYSNPIPISFVKIRPGVRFEFVFNLKDSRFDDIVISSEQKLSVFMALLQYGGLGAKTNVGYGQFKKEKEPVIYNLGDEVEGVIKDLNRNGNRYDVIVILDNSGYEVTANVNDKVFYKHSKGDKVRVKISKLEDNGMPKYGNLMK